MLLALFLSGCAGNQRCDPRFDTDFVSTINCSATDGYNKSVVQANSELNVARQGNTNLRQQLETVRIEQSQLEQSIRMNDAELLASETELAAIERKLAVAKSNNKQLSREKTKLKKETQKINALKNGGEQQKQKLATKRKQAEDLQRAVDSML